MKILIVLILAIGMVSAFNLRSEKIISRQRFLPVVEHEGRIAGGENASIANFPFHVQLTIVIGTTKYMCGGTLITPEWVMSAAHCVEGAHNVYAYFGSDILNQGTRVKVIQIIMHEQYSNKSLQFDICLLRVKKQTLGPTVGVVKLPQSSNSCDQYISQNATAIGFGRLGDNKNTSNILQSIQMTVTSRDPCAEAYGSVHTDTIICLRTFYVLQNRSACPGDSGGALVLPAEDPKDHVQIGLTSFGSASGCEKGFPVAYTCVPMFRNWIAKITGT